jgi:hypothetical protein
MTELESYIEALTPSQDTKHAYIGEFKFEIPFSGYDENGEWSEFTNKVTVPWTTVKDIMKAIKARADSGHAKIDIDNKLIL